MLALWSMEIIDRNRLKWKVKEEKDHGHNCNKSSWTILLSALGNVYEKSTVLAVNKRKNMKQAKNLHLVMIPRVLSSAAFYLWSVQYVEQFLNRKVNEEVKNNNNNVETTQDKNKNIWINELVYSTTKIPMVWWKKESANYKYL